MGRSYAQRNSNRRGTALIGGLSKGGTSFLPGSRIEMGLDEALKPIRDPEALRNATPEEFAERAGRVPSELNYVHPLREGNGRAQEAFISELGRHYGHEIDFSVIAKPRMIEASIETTNNPSSPVMKQVIEDAMNPGRREAIDPHSKTCERSAKSLCNTKFAPPARARRSQKRFSATTIALPAL